MFLNSLQDDSEKHKQVFNDVNIVSNNRHKQAYNSINISVQNLSLAPSSINNINVLLPATENEKHLVSPSLHLGLYRYIARRVGSGGGVLCFVLCICERGPLVCVSEWCRYRISYIWRYRYSWSLVFESHTSRSFTKSSKGAEKSSRRSTSCTKAETYTINIQEIFVKRRTAGLHHPSRPLLTADCWPAGLFTFGNPPRCWSWNWAKLSLSLSFGVASLHTGTLFNSSDRTNRPSDWVCSNWRASLLAPLVSIRIVLSEITWAEPS